MDGLCPDPLGELIALPFPLAGLRGGPWKGEREGEEGEGWCRGKMGGERWKKEKGGEGKGSRERVGEGKVRRDCAVLKIPLKSPGALFVNRPPH